MSYLIKLAHICKLPKEESLYVYELEDMNKKNLIYFMKKIQKVSLDRFLMKNNDGEPWRKIKDFIPDLSRILPKIPMKLVFSNFSFSSRDFQHFINSSFGWKEIHIHNCQLLFDEITFSNNKKCKIKELILFGCGHPLKSNWKDNPLRFKNLIKAISKSGIKNSIEVIIIDGSYPTKEELRTILVSFGIENIKVR